MDIVIRKGNIGDIPAVMGLIKELALFEKAPGEVTNNEQDMETGDYVTGIIYDSNGVDFNKTSRLKDERPTRIQ